jgi:hypothetical protein
METTPTSSGKPFFNQPPGNHDGSSPSAKIGLNAALHRISQQMNASGHEPPRLQ